ncbi:MAG TPA: hypothetical protein PLZ51_29115, partial [Aggregatilineales bacterium]|nr:hypothetical protein [Aggregatilineales bacterium]
DETITSAEKTPKNGQYVAPDGSVWESLDAFFASIPEDAPDETETRRVWTNDEGEEDHKHTPMSDVERLIVAW